MRYKYKDMDETVTIPKKPDCAEMEKAFSLFPGKISEYETLPSA